MASWTCTLTAVLSLSLPLATHCSRTVLTNPSTNADTSGGGLSQSIAPSYPPVIASCGGFILQPGGPVFSVRALYRHASVGRQPPQGGVGFMILLWPGGQQDSRTRPWHTREQAAAGIGPSPRWSRGNGTVCQPSAACITLPFIACRACLKRSERQGACRAPPQQCCADMTHMHVDGWLLRHGCSIRIICTKIRIRCYAKLVYIRWYCIRRDHVYLAAGQRHPRKGIYP